MKKIVIFGGGTGLSQLLKGIKLFPVEITSVVSVADNGGSTGKLRKELNIPAVGDITKVMLAASNVDEDIIKLLNYKFKESKTLGAHSVKNLLLTALLDIKGSFNESIPVLSKLLDIDNEILPLTEDSINLVGLSNKGKSIYGEAEVTNCPDKIVKLSYDKDFTVNKKVYEAIDKADLIIFSSGSLFTSVVPHLIDKKLSNYIAKANAKKLYVCNLFTQPGETDGLSVSQHIDFLEQYFDSPCIDAVIANNNVIKGPLAKKYLTKEQKDFVRLDKRKLKNYEIDIIESDLVIVEENYFRHDSLKTAYLIFRYLMEGK